MKKWLDKYEIPEAQNGIEGTMGGLTDKGFNYSPAWGGAWRDGGILQPPMAGANQTLPMYAMGGNIPGAVGFTYARTQGIPSEGPYGKKTVPSAQNGASIPVIEDVGDFKDGVWVPNWKAMAAQAKKLGAKKVKTKSGSVIYFNDNWEVTGANDNPKAQNGQEMRFYQEGLDWTPKNISEYGSEIHKAQVGDDIPWYMRKSSDISQRGNQKLKTEIATQKTKEKKAQEARTRTTIGADTRTAKQKEKDRQAYEDRVKYEEEVLGRDFTMPTSLQERNREQSERIIHNLVDVPLTLMPVGELAYLGGKGIVNVAPKVGEYLTTQTPLRNAYKYNPWAFKPNPESLYRGIGEAGYRDAIESGLIRPNPKGKYQDLYTSPSFEFAETYGGYGKGKQHMVELPKILEKNAKDIQFDGSEVIFDKPIPIDNAKFYKQDWLRGYKEVPKPKSEALPPPQQNNFGSIYTLNPITALGDLGDYQYYRKIGSGGGIKDLIESGAIRSGGGYDAPYFSPETTWEGYRGTFAVGVNPKQVEGLEMLNKNKAGLQRGYKSSLNEIPLSEGATGVFRRFPFSSAYTEIPIISVLDPSKRSLREKILLNPTLANIQHGSEEALRYGIKASGAQYVGNELYGTKENPTPLGTPLLLPAISYLKKDVGKLLSNKPEQKKKGGVVKDNDGYWNPDNWGKVVEIDSPDITMKNVEYGPLLGISDEGDVQYMEPGKDYKFKGKKVKEYPVAKNGVNQQDEKTVQHLDQLLNFTNYNKPKAKNGWLDKYN